MVSFHLTGGEALLALFFACEALAALYTPCMQCDFLLQFNTILAYLSKKNIYHL